MKAAVFAAVLSVLVALVVCRPDDGEKYDEKFDNYDVEALLNDKEKLQAVGKCFVEKGPCTDLAKAFKEMMTESFDNDCKKCTEKQEKNLRKFFIGIKEKEPEIFAEMTKFYNPDGKYDEKLKKFLAEGQ